MKTSKQDLKEETSKKEDKYVMSKRMQKIFAWLELRGRFTAVCMILVLLFTITYLFISTFFLFTETREKKSNPLPSNNQIRIGGRDIMKELNEYAVLREYQKLLEEMQRDSTKIDSAKVEEIINYLLK